jgi:mono/diheme cytochrome c family protein
MVSLKPACRPARNARWLVVVGILIALPMVTSGAEHPRGPNGDSAAAAQPSTPLRDASDGAQSGGPARPTDLVLCGPRAVVATERGWLCVVDRATRAIERSWQVGERLVDLEWLPERQLLAAVDQASSELLLFAPTPDGNERPFALSERRRTADDPVQVASSSDGRWMAVACRWSRTVELYEWLDERARRVASAQTLRIPFAPLRLVWLDRHRRLLVADAFGGRLALIDPARRSVTHTVTIRGHNLRGMAYDPMHDEVVIAYQQLTSHLPTTHDHVFWGNVIGNLVMTVKMDEMTDEQHANEDFRPLAHWSLQTLGRAEAGGGDPSGLVLLPDGGRLVCLTGVGELAVSRRRWGFFERIAAGTSPSSAAVDPDRSEAWVVDRFGDQVMVIDWNQRRTVATISVCGQAQSAVETSAERGERLFYDARLSLDGWFSCHSCHSDGHTCGQNNDNFGDGSDGAAKRIPSLLGTSGTAPWTWRGLQPRLRDQIAQSIESTMQHPKAEIDESIVADLEAYLQSLQPPPGINRARRRVAEAGGDERLAQAERAGQELFQQLGCAACHAGPRFTSDGVSDVGLTDTVGERQFNAPSLLGVSQRDRWLHDGRAETLADVFQRAHHPLGQTAVLTELELHNLLAYLNML